MSNGNATEPVTGGKSTKPRVRLPVKEHTHEPPAIYHRLVRLAVSSDAFHAFLKFVGSLPGFFYVPRHQRCVEEGRALRRSIMSIAGVPLRTYSAVYTEALDLLESLRANDDARWLCMKVNSLVDLIRRYPDLNLYLFTNGVTREVARIIDKTKSPLLHDRCRLALALMGHSPPPKGRGVRILSLDGGGSRGVVALETLKAIESATGKKTHELFDYIAGVSAGAIMAALVGPMRMELEQIERYYIGMCQQLFRHPGWWWGTGRLVLSHSLYDTTVYEEMLRFHTRGLTLEECAVDLKCPKIGLLSSTVRRGQPTTFIFRNYVVAPGFCSRFPGNTGLKYTLSDAIRASSAAPGIFKEAKIGGEVHIDGGLTSNNPTAVAIHECRNIWPNVPIRAVVSVGTGLWTETAMSDLRRDVNRISTLDVQRTSMWKKLNFMYNSATDTQRIHSCLKDTLPNKVYYRFNPLMSDNVRLDEADAETIRKLQKETVYYLNRNRRKLGRLAVALKEKPAMAAPFIRW